MGLFTLPPLPLFLEHEVGCEELGDIGRMGMKLPASIKIVL